VPSLPDLRRSTLRQNPGNCVLRGLSRIVATVASVRRQFEVRELMVLAHQDVIELLLDEESGAMAELEVAIGRPIRLQTEALYTQDQFDVVLL